MRRIADIERTIYNKTSDEIDKISKDIFTLFRGTNYHEVYEVAVGINVLHNLVTIIDGLNIDVQNDILN